MNNITSKPVSELARNFIPEAFIPQGKDEYYLRNQQNPDILHYRNLTAHEIEVLVRNNNTSSDWNQLLVSEAFNPELVKNCKFFGLVRIGKLEPLYLEFNDLRMPVGLYNSTIINCDLGDNVVVDNVNFLAYYIIGNEVIIVNVNEMATTNHAKFGNGILKEGESQSVRIWLEICNENGGRAVMPFEGMLAGDAWLWSRNRDNEDLQRRFREMTEKYFDNLLGYYGTVGDRTVIKNCSIIKDVKIGSDAYLKGANKLKNLTINSKPGAQSQIGEGCELVNGIIGYGSRIFYGVKAVRFMLGANSQLKYGARLINSYLGDNSTISCCEVLNSLIFPGHEQHHNNSFLIAAAVCGQSNIAAGATLGSNHNSRGADGEMHAARGFWPGLCTSLKHNSRFAEFIILTKSDYLFELDIPFPFALVSNDLSGDKLQILPAYWLKYNQFALFRNSAKYADRDKRTEKIQLLESDFLAPDTVNAMFAAIDQLEMLAGKFYLGKEAIAGKMNHDELRTAGRRMFVTHPKESQSIYAEPGLFENSKRKAEILHPAESYHTYINYIKFYAIRELINHLVNNSSVVQSGLQPLLDAADERKKFENTGGQLLSSEAVELLRQKIVSYEIISWQQVHEFYQAQGETYADQRFAHAISSLKDIFALTGEPVPSLEVLADWYLGFRQQLLQDMIDTRKKDYENPFRKMLYTSDKEMEAVMGKLNKTTFMVEQKEQLQHEQERVKILFQIG